jgi:hypothetical protein
MPFVGEATIMLNLALFAALTFSSDVVRFYSGTIIAMQKDEKRFLVVADSRSSDNARTSHRDDACKVVGLGEQAFFFATGRTSATGRDEKVVFDLNDIALRVFNDFSRLPNDENRLYSVSFYTAIFAKAVYQDMAVQQPLGFLEGIDKGNLAKIVIGGTLADGSLIAFLVNINAESTSSAVPLISFAVEKWNQPAGYEIAGFGSREKDGVVEFLANKTERAKTANDRFQAEITANKANSDAEIIRLKAAVAAAIDWAENKNMVGGPLDILELRRGGRLNWIQRKENCK